MAPAVGTSDSSASKPPLSWSDLSARRPLPIHFVLLPSRRTPTPLKPTPKSKRSEPTTFHTHLTPAWACYVPSSFIHAGAGTEDPDQPARYTTETDDTVTARASGVTIIRVLDPEFREPFISFGALCEACGETSTEGLIRFAKLLCRPVLPVPQTPATDAVSDSPMTSPSSSPVSSTIPLSSSPGASIVEVSLAGLEPCTELWVPLAVARKVAATYGALEPLALLLSWNTRHAWSLDEGETGVIHNWRLPATILPSVSYSLMSLLSTPITSPVEVMTRNTQIRTLISEQERQSLIHRWRSPFPFQAAPSPGAPQASSSEQSTHAPKDESVARAGDLRLSLPDATKETLIRWSIRTLDEHDEAREALARAQAGGRPSNRRASVPSGLVGAAHTSSQQQSASPFEDSFVATITASFGKSINLRQSPNLASLILVLKEIVDRTEPSPVGKAVTSICDGAITLTNAEMAWLAAANPSGTAVAAESSEKQTMSSVDQARSALVRTKAKVLLVHYLSALYNRQHAGLRAVVPPSEPPSDHPAELDVEPTEPLTTMMQKRAQAEKSARRAKNPPPYETNRSLDNVQLTTLQKRMDRLEASVGRVESALNVIVKHLVPARSDPEEARETRKVRFDERSGGSTSSGSSYNTSPPRSAPPQLPPRNDTTLSEETTQVESPDTQYKDSNQQHQDQEDPRQQTLHLPSETYPPALHPVSSYNVPSTSTHSTSSSPSAAAGSSPSGEEPDSYRFVDTPRISLAAMEADAQKIHPSLLRQFGLAALLLMFAFGIGRSTSV